MEAQIPHQTSATHPYLNFSRPANHSLVQSQFGQGRRAPHRTTAVDKIGKHATILQVLVRIIYIFILMFSKPFPNLFYRYCTTSFGHPILMTLLPAPGSKSSEHLKGSRSVNGVCAPESERAYVATSHLKAKPSAVVAPEKYFSGLFAGG